MSRLKVLYGFHAVTARLRADASSIEEVLYDPTRKDRRMQDFLRTAKEAGVRLIAADESRARELLERSTAAATALSPYIGYAETAAIAKEAVKTGKTIRELVLARGLLDAAQLDSILSVDAMTKGGIVGKAR